MAVSVTDIHLERATGILHLQFDDGLAASLDAEYLRVESPSAEVQGHGPGQRQLVGGKRSVRIDRIIPVGHYAIQLVFDDGHDSGLFSWEYLHQLARERPQRWPAYENALAARGLSR